MLLLRDGNLLLVKQPQATAVPTSAVANQAREDEYNRITEEFYQNGIDCNAVRETRKCFRLRGSKVELTEHKQEPSDPHSVMLPPLPRLAVLPLPQAIGQPALQAAKDLIRSLEQSLQASAVLSEGGKAVVYYNELASLHLTLFQNSRVSEPRGATQVQIAKEVEAWHELSRTATGDEAILLVVHSICLTAQGQVLLLLQGADRDVEEKESELNTEEGADGDGAAAMAVDDDTATLSAVTDSPGLERGHSSSALLDSDSSSTPPPPPPPAGPGIFSPTHPVSPSSPSSTYRKASACYSADRHPIDQLRHLATNKFTDAPSYQSVLFHVTLARIVNLPTAQADASSDADGAAADADTSEERPIRRRQQPVHPSDDSASAATIPSITAAMAIAAVGADATEPAATATATSSDGDSAQPRAIKLAEEQLEPFRRRCNELSAELKGKQAAVGHLWYIEEKLHYSAQGDRKIIEFADA
jgi:hypothetical protein